MVRPDPHDLSIFCVERNARLWRILCPYYSELLDAGDSCQSWSRNLAECIAIPDEESIDAE